MCSDPLSFKRATLYLSAREKMEMLETLKADHDRYMRAIEAAPDLVARALCVLAHMACALCNPNDVCPNCSGPAARSDNGLYCFFSATRVA